MNDLTITVLEMLWFGLISGGIIVFAINYWLTQRAIRIKKNGYLILLTIEMLSVSLLSIFLLNTVNIMKLKSDLLLLVIINKI